MKGWARAGKSNTFCTIIDLHHLVLGVLEAVCDVVDGLVLGDGVLLEAGLLRQKLPDVGLVREAVLELAERRQQTGTVRLQVALLAAQAELHREPVALPQAQRTAPIRTSTMSELAVSTTI